MGMEMIQEQWRKGYQASIELLKGMTRLSRLAWRAGSWVSLLLIAATIIAGLVPAIELWVFGHLVDQLSTVIQDVTGGAPELVLNGLLPVIPWIVFLIGIRLLGRGMDQIEKWNETHLQELMTYHIQSDVLSKAYRLPLRYFEQSTFHDKLERANDGMGLGLSNLLFAVVKVVESLVMMAGLAFLTIKGHWLIPILILGAGIPILVLQNKYNADQYAMVHGHTPKNRMKNYLTRLLSEREAAKEVRLFGIGPYLTGKWRNTYEQLRKEVLQQSIHQRIRLGLIHTLHVLTFGISLFLVLWSLSTGSVSLGEATAIIFAILRMQERWELCIIWMGSIQYFYIFFVRDLLQFLDLAEHQDREKEDRVESSGSSALRLDSRPHRLTVENLSFTYPSSTKPVLKNISFQVEPGEKVAILGENGAGKSTLVKLLLGLYLPTQGSIRYGGYDAQDIEPHHLRQHVSAVFQDYAQYHLSLKENIGFGQLEQMNDARAIGRAAEQGGADALARKSKDGYGTMLGPTFGGQDLSGGEWQKVAISRGFMREAHVVVLDEPTSSLDPRAEVEVYERFQEMAGEATALMISHRIGFAQLADRILVLKDGRLIESGTHQELQQNNGEYAKLLEIQSQWYR